jgi:Acetyl-CoA carboxylase, central region
MSVFHLAGCPIQSRLENCHLWLPTLGSKSRVLPKISTLLLEVAKIHRPTRTQIERVDARFFVRAMIRNFEVFSSANDAVMPVPEAERTFCEALHAAEMAGCDSGFRRTDCNHISLNVIPAVRIDAEYMQEICRRLFT